MARLSPKTSKSGPRVWRGNAGLPPDPAGGGSIYTVDYALGWDDPTLHAATSGRPDPQTET